VISTEHSVSCVLFHVAETRFSPRQHRSSAYSCRVALRVITLLVAAVVMMTAATASQADIASPDDIASAVDDTPDLDTPIVPTVIAVPAPEQHEVVCVLEGPSIDRGRVHAVTVFRPPRRVASR